MWDIPVDQHHGMQNDNGRVFTKPVFSLDIPEGVMFTDKVKRLKNDRCFQAEDYISGW